MDFGFVLKKLIATLILPPGGLVLWLALGALIAMRWRKLGLTMVWIGVLAFYAASTPVVTRSLQAPLEQTYPPWSLTRMKQAAQQPKAIVILGGGTIRGALEYGGETLKMYTLRRVRYGARVAHQTGLPILVTGGRPEESRLPEAVLMDESLRTDFGVSARWLEERAMDTQDNAAFSVPILQAAKIDTVILVTDIDHMPRAQREFETRGIKIIPAATNYQASAPITYRDLLPSMAAFTQTYDLTYEWLGRVWQSILQILH